MSFKNKSRRQRHQVAVETLEVRQMLSGVAVGPKQQVVYADPTGGLVPSLEWSMADHFGKNYDLNGNGRADLPNTFSYVNPSQGYEVTLDATDTKVPVNLAPASYTWKITDASGRSQTHAGIKPTLALQEGAYSVELTVRSGQFRQTTRESIQVDNIFIVSIGDSYASGEGNPEIDAQWKWGYDDFNHFGRIIKKHASWADAGISSESEKIGKEHAEAHRSTLSAPAQAAMALEYLDKHTSVTFVSLAASGATINDLILNVHGDADEYDQVLRPQQKHKLQQKNQPSLITN